MRKTILLIEDNMEYLQNTAKELIEEGYNVICAYDGDTGIEMFENNSIDIIILDMYLPQKHGISVLEEIRSKSDIPIIVLTGANHCGYQKRCFDLEVADYVIRPCYTPLLVKKIELVLREQYEKGECNYEEWVYDNVKVNFRKKIIMKADKKVVLGKTPMEILRVLVRNKGNIISRDQIISYVWGNGVEINDRTVDSHISRIKRNLELDCIKAISGYGYKLEG